MHPTILKAALLCFVASRAWPAADLAVTMAADRLSVQPGASGSDLVNIAVGLRNDGPDPASALVTARLPAGLRIPPGMSATTDAGIYDPATGRWLVGTLGARQGASLMIPAQATTAATDCLVNMANATFASGSTYTDPDTANNQARLVIGAPACAELVVSSRRDNRLGATCVDALHTIRIDNLGPSAASDVVLDVTRYEVTSPANYDEASCTTGGVVVPGRTTVDLGILAAGASREYVTGLRNLPTDGPDIEVAYDVRASSAEPDPDLADNREASQYVIRRPFDEDDDDDSDFLCIVSGALGGSGMERHIPELRRFRDRWLMTNRPGRLLVRLYEEVSPPLARQMSRHESLRTAVRIALAPIVYAICFPAATGALLAATLLAAIMTRLPARPRAALGAR